MAIACIPASQARVEYRRGRFLPPARGGLSPGRTTAGDGPRLRTRRPMLDDTPAFPHEGDRGVAPYGAASRTFRPGIDVPYEPAGSKVHGVAQMDGRPVRMTFGGEAVRAHRATVTRRVYLLPSAGPQAP